jgi:P pilus assembly chaperone PapD
MGENMAHVKATIGIVGLLGLALFAAAAAHAGIFEVNPVRIHLEKKKPTAAITLRNTG